MGAAALESEVRQDRFALGAIGLAPFGLATFGRARSGVALFGLVFFVDMVRSPGNRRFNSSGSLV